MYILVGKQLYGTLLQTYRAGTSRYCFLNTPWFPLCSITCAAEGAAHLYTCQDQYRRNVRIAVWEYFFAERIRGARSHKEGLLLINKAVCTCKRSEVDRKWADRDIYSMSVFRFKIRKDATMWAFQSQWTHHPCCRSTEWRRNRCLPDQAATSGPSSISRLIGNWHLLANCAQFTIPVVARQWWHFVVPPFLWPAMDSVPLHFE